MEIDGNDSLSHEHKEEIHILHKSMDLLCYHDILDSGVKQYVD